MMQYTTSFKQIKENARGGMRNRLRKVALDGLSIKNKLTNQANILSRPRIQFLYIHHVFEDEAVNFDVFLRELGKHHSFIRYSEAVHKIHTNTIDKPYIVLSSDDGLKNNLIAMNVMDNLGIKGCFFVNPDTIGLSDYDQIKTFCNRQLNFPPTEFLNWNDLETMLRNGHEIGSHTIGHIRISDKTLPEVEDNLNESFRILKERLGGVNHFAFPYGRFSDFNAEAMELVFNAGYVSCASAERGCHFNLQIPPDPKRIILRRDHIIADWNINHSMYFIQQNARKNASHTHLNPYV